jgi:transcriptional regulator with GAF, ATPase, and Fis domain
MPVTAALRAAPFSAAVPTGLTATAADKQVTLNWTAAARAASYTVKRSLANGGPYTEIASSISSTTYSNTGLTNGTTYYYVVSAGNIIGDSPPMQKVFQTIEKVADTDSTIMILGESGTGKELVARALHYNSSRAKGPIVPVNCAAIPSELLESELFGHEKGAFTNAIRTRVGRFELAHGGTIFLDEIGDMDPVLQSKLLRVLQDRAFERIGGTRTIQVDIRVITATHRNLKKEVENGRFREDLYYRLNVIPIEIPPLREHKSDIPLLVHHFIDQFNKSKKRNIRGLEEEALQKLKDYEWPGNIRELENMIERIAILTNNEVITLSDLPERIQALPPQDQALPLEIPEEGISLDSAVSEFERRLILQALTKTGWVKNKAAQLLNLNRTTLIEKIKRQNLQAPPA